jgi:excinuclease UvrABC nuclease subunit
MVFYKSDNTDKRVVEASPYAVDYPGGVDKAPDKAGVYMFIDGDDQVIYIGKASGGRLRDEIRSKRGASADRGAKKCRWFRTNSDEVSEALEADWIKKYQPKNNVLDKYLGAPPSVSTHHNQN